MFVVALVIFVPFFVWGLYALHKKYQRQQDLPPWLEAITLLGVVLFYALEIDQLHEVMSLQPLMYVFTLLGLFVAGMALYGHMAISLSSRLIVDIVVPSGEEVSDRPRFGPAEMLERQNDYESALQEYWILARTYPRNPQVHRRIAECFLHLKRPEEAVKWFERALQNMKDPDKALPVLSRLCDIYLNVLQQPGATLSALGRFIQEYPNTKAAETARARLSALGAAVEEKPVDTALASLDAAPIEDTPLSPPKKKQPKIPAASPPSLTVEPLLEPIKEPLSAISELSPNEAALEIDSPRLPPAQKEKSNKSNADASFLEPM
ncbi:MAG TPA: tetratricopeptide repeat protein [Candidatus Hydrogenedentes bacterium]|nr:tetratricopeptide repeat protein [Candidatus Hydrogenedentota bacterium]